MSLPSDRVAPRRALVTGAAGGLGAAIARRLHADGCVVCGLDVDATGLATLAGGEDSERLTTEVVDLTSAADVQSVVDRIGGRLGGIDIVVNAAGVISKRSLADLDVDEWDRVMAVNLRAPFIMARAAVAHMGSGGVIVNITSIHARVAGPETMHYAVSKAGLEHLTNALAVSLGERSIRVVAVAPGSIATAMPGFGRSEAEAKRDYLTDIPLGRMADPSDIAGAVSFLVGPDAQSITGTTLVVDGGFLVKR